MAIQKGKGVFTVSTADVQELVTGDGPAFPKYTTQIMNLANSTAQGTRPKVVGQMSDLVPECGAPDYAGWVEWYEEHMPHAVEAATDKVWAMVQQYQEAGAKIDRDMVEEWVRDLVLTKTFIGLMTQKAVLEILAERYKLGDVRAARPEDESKGIDGYLGEQPVSVKPHTYTSKNLPESIGVPVVFYEKKKTGIVIDASQLEAALGPRPATHER